jgi:hypothetical protein
MLLYADYRELLLAEMQWGPERIAYWGFSSFKEAVIS